MAIESEIVSCKIGFILKVFEYCEKFINVFFRCYARTGVLWSDIPPWLPVTGSITGIRLEFLPVQVSFRM